MNKQHISALLAITSLAFSSGSIAQNMSESEYKAAVKNISNEYKSDQVKCGSFANNDKDICMAVARGKEKVAKNNLEARYKPSHKAVYQVSVAKAQADYALAKEKCDDKAGNDKDACVIKAKAALLSAKIDARTQLKTSKAITAANEAFFAARMDAKEKGIEARHDAAPDV